jgi:hypothetical protein
VVVYREYEMKMMMNKYEGMSQRDTDTDRDRKRARVIYIQLWIDIEM